MSPKRHDEAFIAQEVLGDVAEMCVAEHMMRQSSSVPSSHAVPKTVASVSLMHPPGHTPQRVPETFALAGPGRSSAPRSDRLRVAGVSYALSLS